MRTMPQSSHCSICPPSAAVRQSSIALITRRSTRPMWPASGGRHDLQPQPVEGAWRLRDDLARDLGIARRGREIVVAEQHLDDADVGAVLQKVGGKAVPQRVHRYPLAKARGLAGGPAGRI